MRRRILAAFLICMTLSMLAACAGSKEEKTSSGPSTSVDEQDQEEKSEVVPDEEKSADQAHADNKSIVVYFSRVGNTDFPDGVDASSSASIQIDDGATKGNAQMIAEWIAEEAGCDTQEILVKDSYPVDYDETVDQARDEQSEGTKPALKTEFGNMGGYDTVYLIFPN